MKYLLILPIALLLPSCSFVQSLTPEQIQAGANIVQNVIEIIPAK